MHAAIKLVCKAMVDDLGDAISSQVRDFAGGESFSAQNPAAMRRALEWLVEHDRMLKQALNEEGYAALGELAYEIEVELEEARQ